MKKGFYNKVLHFYYVSLLLITSFFLSIYILLCTPFVFIKKLGILATSLISQTLWTIFDKIFANTFDLKLDVEELKKIQNKENVIILSNHIGAIDFMAINEISKRKNMLRHAKHMIKESVKYIPILGYVQFLGFPMLKRKYEKDKNEIVKWLSYFKQANIPVWFVIFPEGTRFTAKKKAESDKFCREKGFNELQNVLYPKVKGFELSLQNLKGYVKHVVDLTIMYENNGCYEPPSLFKFLFGNVSGNFYIKVNVYDVNEIKNADEFIKNLFYKKDETIQAWKNKIKKEK